jgi:hypothetical protein
MKAKFIILLLLLLVNLVRAQADGMYRIKLMTISKDSDNRIFNKLKDLGIVSYEPTQNESLRVYLGTYLGKNTASRVLVDVKNRGFSSAYVESTGGKFVAESGDSLTHTMQFIALKRLDIRAIVDNPKLAKSDQKDVYIWYHNGFYRVSLGIINPNQNEQIAHFKGVTDNMGFKTSFVQKFAGVKPNPETNVVKPQPKIEKPVNLFPTDVTPLKKKDIFEVENKKAQEPYKSSVKVDPNAKPKDTKVSPNATLKPAKTP